MRFNGDIDHKGHCELERTAKIVLSIVIIFSVPGLNTVAFVCLSSVLALSAMLGIPLVLVGLMNFGLERLHKKMCSVSFWLGSTVVAFLSLWCGFICGFVGAL